MRIMYIKYCQFFFNFFSPNASYMDDNTWVSFFLTTFNSINQKHFDKAHVY